MNHITETILDNGMVRLVPDDGYKLRDNRSYRLYKVAEVEVADKKYFVAVQI